MRRRDFITLVGGATVAWPLVAQAQQPEHPVVAFINGGSAYTYAGRVSAFRKGLSETGYIEDQNVRVEYHWLEGHYERLPALLTEIIGRRVAVIATPASTPAAIAAKAATATIPIVFSVGEGIQSRWALSSALRIPAATQRESTFSPSKPQLPNGLRSCMSFCPKRLVSRGIDQSRQRRVHQGGHFESAKRRRAHAGA